MFGIEYICIGNNGRSRMAHIIGEHYLLEKNLSDKIKIYSSGTLGDHTGDHQIYPSMMFAVERGLKKDAFPSPLRNLAEQVVEGRSSQTEAIRCIRHLMAQERIFVESSLLEWGYSSTHRFNQKTVLRPEADLILPFGEENVQTVKEIYQGQEKRIILLDDFVDDHEKLDTLGVPFETVRQTRDIIARKVRKSIDLVVEGA